MGPVFSGFGLRFTGTADVDCCRDGARQAGSTCRNVDIANRNPGIANRNAGIASYKAGSTCRNAANSFKHIIICKIIYQKKSGYSGFSDILITSAPAFAFLFCSEADQYVY